MSRNALIVGINTYRQLHTLKSPSEDAEAVARMLEQYGDFHVTRLHAVKDETNPSGKMSRKKPVTCAQLEEALIQLFCPQGKHKPDTALFFFSGHGLRRDRRVYQEGFLADSQADLKERWGLSMQWLCRLLETSEVKQQIVWLDCCHSGELLNFEQANPGSRGNVRDRSFISASREYEAAYEETTGKHGLLTGALLKALDPSRQGADVTNYSVCDYISGHLRSAIQAPVFTNFGGPVILTRMAKKAAAPKPQTKGICPYKGLAYFDYTGNDPDYFFGREAMTDDLIDRVRKNNFLAVLGPSGSGKSSVVRAGLLHQLKLGRKISGSENWPIRIFRPGENPLENLAWAFVDADLSDIDRTGQLRSAKELIGKGVDAFSDLVHVTAKNGRLILVVDQFEEVFTLCRDLKKRKDFFKLILGTLPVSDMKICLILTMRADFFGKCAEGEYAGLPEQIQEHLFTITPMTDAELRQAIEEPAKKAGFDVLPELIDQIIGDVKDSPGSLPLLQYTLTDLWNTLTEFWKQKEENQLVLSAYARMGGVKGTLSKRADEVYEELGKDEQAVAKHIFIELTQLGEGTEDTRRQVSRQNLITSLESEALVDGVIQKLADEKLIVTGEVRAKDEMATGVAVVDVAHEALIRNWTRLRIWLDENRDDIRFQRRLDAAARHWRDNGEPEGLLWRSPDLELLEQFYEKLEQETTDIKVSFFYAAMRAKDEEKRKKEEAARILLEEKEKAEDLLAKNYWFNAINAKKDGHSLQSLHFYAKAGEKEKQESEIKNSILNIQSALNVSLAYSIQHDACINGAILSKGGRLILTWSDDNTARLWRTQYGRPARQPMKHDDDVVGAVFNKNERLILTWSKDNTARLWHTKNGRPAAQPMKHGRARQGINGAMFNQDESLIFTQAEGDYTARLWHTKDGSPAAQPMKHDYNVRDGDVSDAVFNKDGSLILTWSDDNTARLWRSKDGSPAAPPMKHDDYVRGAVFNKDESLILTCGDKTARLWRTKDGCPATQPMKHEDSVYCAVFNKDESLILTRSGDNTVRLWRTQDGNPATQPMKHDAYVRGAVFNKDESLILTWSSDNTVRLWRTQDGKPAAQTMKHDDDIEGVMFNKNERLILSWSKDNTARLWRTQDGSPAVQPMKHDDWVRGAVFNKDGSMILTWSKKTAHLWHTQDGNPAAQPMKHYSPRDGIAGALFNKDESLILTRTYDDNTAWLWHTQIGRPAALSLKHNDSVKGALFNNDGSLILTWGKDKTVRLWCTKDGRRAALPMKHDDEVRGAVFNKDESLILTWSDIDRTARLWRAQDGRQATQPMKHDYHVRGAMFNKDESLILTWSDDNTARLWRTEDGSPAAQPMKHDHYVRGAVVNKDESLILTWSSDNTARLWRTEDGSPAAQPMKHDNS
ncbi:caspase family protein, partial [Desulfococcaceae bacterium HSG9]|nr:caspase family protein [Desulfococcaceae bacterium HSG9]